MVRGSFLDRTAGVLVLASLAVVVSGTKACQEDYDFASQTTITPKPADTAGATVTQTPVGTLTPTGTLTAVATVSGTATVAATGTAGEDDGGDEVDTEQASAGTDLFTELSALNSKSATGGSVTAGGGVAGSGNWLGENFKKEEDAGWRDSDGDGFSDGLEESIGSDSADAASQPAEIASTSFVSRIGGQDSDRDGLSNYEEIKRGSNPSHPDSDNDGKSDGAEVLSGGDPVGPGGAYQDSDGDGLSDEYEGAHGMRPDAIDSDGDGLRDDLEVTLASNPSKIDSDSDGISDGREYQLGSDPTIPDAQTAD